MLLVEVVCIEEMINYFEYDYLCLEDEYFFVVYLELVICFWNVEYFLLLVVLQGVDKCMDELLFSNLIFFLDVLGLMGRFNKLLLVKQLIEYLVECLWLEDWVLLVVYVGVVGVVFEFILVVEKQKILDVLICLKLGGFIAGGVGI